MKQLSALLIANEVEYGTLSQYNNLKKLGQMALSLLQNVIGPWYKNTFAMYIPKKWACLHNIDILVCPKMVSDLHRKINGLDMP